MHNHLCAIVVGLTAVACSRPDSSPAFLVTPQEAASPSGGTSRPAVQRAGVVASEASGASGRGGITRDPDITLRSPRSAPVVSPFPLRIAFAAHGGSHIDPTTVIVTYVKVPEIDLTERLKSYTTASGIDVPDAVIPPGEHVLRVAVADDAGRTTVTTFRLVVAGQ